MKITTLFVAFVAFFTQLVNAQKPEHSILTVVTTTSFRLILPLANQNLFSGSGTTKELKVSILKLD